MLYAFFDETERKSRMNPRLNLFYHQQETASKNFLLVSARYDRTRRASTVSTAYKSSVHCTSIPNIPSPKSRWLLFPHRPVSRLNPLWCQEWCQSLKTNQKMPVGKCDIITVCFFLKKTWIEENADWIRSAKTLLRVFVWVSPLQTLKCIQTKTQRFIP